MQSVSSDAVKSAIDSLFKHFEFAANTTMSTVYVRLKSDLGCVNNTEKIFKYVIGRFANHKDYTLMILKWTGTTFIFTYKDNVSDYQIGYSSTAIWNSLDILVFMC